MKAKDLIKKAATFKGQEITIIDHSNHSVAGYIHKLPLSIDKDQAETLRNATVNSFDMSPEGSTLRIHVSPNW